MASPSVTYTFTNATTADATQVNQNFTDIINGLTDGTKSLSIDALTCAGAVALNGTVGLGNSTADTVTITGYVTGLNLNEAAGDPTIGFRIGGSLKWLAGVDDSDSDKFKITNVAAFATDIFSINSSGFITCTNGLSVGSRVAMTASAGLTLSVASCCLFSITTSTSVTINNMSGGTEGQIVYFNLRSASAELILVSGNSTGGDPFSLAGGSNLTQSGISTISVIFSGGSWYLISN